MKKFKQIMSNEKGFTLVEILVVIAIIAILFVTLLPQIDNASTRARETGVKTDFHTFQTAAESYLREVSGKGLSVASFNTFLDPGMQVAAKESAKKDPWGAKFKVNVYQHATAGSAIVVRSIGPDETPNNDDDYIFATYYYKGQVGSCTYGFDTNNIELGFTGFVGKDDCGVTMGDGTTALATEVTS